MGNSLYFPPPERGRMPPSVAQAAGGGNAAIMPPTPLASRAPLPPPPVRGGSDSFAGLQMKRRAGGAGDDQRRTAEEELIDAVLVAVLGEVLEIKDFAHAKAHGRDHDPVPRLIGFGGLVRPHFDAPGVGADRRNLLLLAPVAGEGD